MNLVESALYFDPDTHRNLHSIQRTDNRKGEPFMAMTRPATGVLVRMSCCRYYYYIVVSAVQPQLQEEADSSACRRLMTCLNQIYSLHDLFVHGFGNPSRATHRAFRPWNF